MNIENLQFSQQQNLQVSGNQDIKVEKNESFLKKEPQNITKTDQKIPKSSSHQIKCQYRISSQNLKISQPKQEFQKLNNNIQKRPVPTILKNKGEKNEGKFEMDKRKTIINLNAKKRVIKFPCNLCKKEFPTSNRDELTLRQDHMIFIHRYSCGQKGLTKCHFME